jgi:hypothetical protein
MRELPLASSIAEVRTKKEQLWQETVVASVLEMLSDFDLDG